ncbi:MAG: hypothetical protein V5A46_03585 [Haloferacaceae archaeon]
MIDALGLPAAAQAAIVVGIVLLEAALLYVGYGYLENWAAPHVIERIQNA